ncbi:MAG: hypothetical protein BWK79_04060 [Beggiatoa sp. IS2]|nr:MAG: hypothetical protein BWK79_04060 [Beggiatoa sp. IS2]
MIKEIRFHNWKSFHQATLPLTSLTILMGVNASGKSNALEGLEFLQRVASGKDIQSALLGTDTFPALRGDAEWATRKPGTQFTLSVSVENPEGIGFYIYDLSVRTAPPLQPLAETLTYVNQAEQIVLFKTELAVHNAVDIYLHGDTIITSQNLSTVVIVQLENVLWNSPLLTTGVKTVLQALRTILVLDPIPANLRAYTSLSQTLKSDAHNVAGLLINLPEAQKNAVEETLSRYLSELLAHTIRRVWAEPVGRFGIDAMLYCEEEWTQGSLTLMDARGMSDGVLRFVAILTAILTQPLGSQLVIEQVDTNLHFSQVNLLLHILQELGQQRHIQLLVTIQNPTLLNNLTLKELPQVFTVHRDKATGTSRLTQV